MTTQSKRLQAAIAVWRELKPVAMKLRRELTPAERALWQAVRGSQLDGLKFRRQHVIDYFIVDFYCVPANLVIEVDGPIHDRTVEVDEARQEYLEWLGLRVLRFRNEEVLTNLDDILTRIKEATSEARA